jgi:hypothetical protein
MMETVTTLDTPESVPVPPGAMDVVSLRGKAIAMTEERKATRVTINNAIEEGCRSDYAGK